MSEIKEATGHGRVSLTRAMAVLEQNPAHGKVQPSIARVRVQKIRDGKVYEDRVIEYGVHR